LHIFLGCNAIYFGETLTFRRKLSPASSGSMCKPRQKQAETDGKVMWCGFMLFLLFHPED
jgi:hypothetical protein